LQRLARRLGQPVVWLGRSGGALAPVGKFVVGCGAESTPEGPNVTEGAAVLLGAGGTAEEALAAAESREGQ
jgi:hypothetical protein